LLFVSRNILTHLDGIVGWVKPVKKTMDRPKTMLIIRWDRIGDAVVTLPLIQALHQQYPDLGIDVLCSTHNAWVMEGYPGVRRVIPCPGVGFTYGANRLWRWLLALIRPSAATPILAAIGSHEYDVCLDCLAGEFTPVFKRFATTYLGPKTEDGFSWIYDAYPATPIRYAQVSTAQYFFNFFCEMVGDPPARLFPISNVPMHSHPKLPKMRGALPFILINVAGESPERRIESGTLVSLIRQLSQRFSVAVFDAPNGRALAKISPALPAQVQQLPAMALTALVVLAQQALCLISTDNGAAHYLATNCPAIVMFGEKSYNYNCYPFFPCGEPYERVDYPNASLWYNNRYAALIQRPQYQAPFKPYVVSNRSLRLPISTIEPVICNMIDHFRRHSLKK
jgi:ADP-heptose:LPS heptosyltransferase